MLGVEVGNKSIELVALLEFHSELDKVPFARAMASFASKEQLHQAAAHVLRQAMQLAHTETSPSHQKLQCYSNPLIIRGCCCIQCVLVYASFFLTWIVRLRLGRVPHLCCSVKHDVESLD